MDQYSLNFEPGLTDIFPEFHDCLKASVYGCGKPFKAIAADLDMSSSRLSRMMNEADEGINFPASRLDELVAVTGDKRPIYWLIEKHLRDDGARKKRALDRLEELSRQIESTLKVLGDQS